jgi:hypothetical protein
MSNVQCPLSLSWEHVCLVVQKRHSNVSEADRISTKILSKRDDASRRFMMVVEWSIPQCCGDKKFIFDDSFCLPLLARLASCKWRQNAPPEDSLSLRGLILFIQVTSALGFQLDELPFSYCERFAQLLHCRKLSWNEWVSTQSASLLHGCGRYNRYVLF